MLKKSLLICSVVPFVFSTEPGTGKFEPWLEELWAREGHPHDPLPEDAPLELRISKGLGPKGYNKVRVSLISSKLEDFRDFNFSYKQQFKYRWTENFLHSSLVELRVGSNKLKIGGRDVVIDLPAETEGIRGVFWSDPCISSKWITCKYGERFQTLNRSVGMLNEVYKDPSMNFFSILGDNFYDRTGEITKTIIPRMSADVKRRFLLVVNGNHDNWVKGDPSAGVKEDNFGIGQMQYYASDSHASVLEPQNDVDFMDFSVNPDVKQEWKTWQNVGPNFLQYHKLGNVGFLSFSGAADFKEMQPHFEKACEYFDKSKPSVVFLLGHWNEPNLGCERSMTTPAVHKELLSMKGCSALGQRFKFIDGHEHCNYVSHRHNLTKEGYGFMIGAHGMDDSKCQAQYGFLFMDSTAGRVKLHYFEVDSELKGDRYQQIIDCVRSRGSLASCTSFADTWLDISADVIPEDMIEI